jgi:hypothetical protein
MAVSVTSWPLLIAEVIGGVALLALLYLWIVLTRNWRP